MKALSFQAVFIWEYLFKSLLLKTKKSDCLHNRILSGWQDSNLRPPGPKPGAITGLRYTPNFLRKGIANVLHNLFYTNVFKKIYANIFRALSKSSGVSIPMPTWVVSIIRIFFPYSKYRNCSNFSDASKDFIGRE